MKIHLLLLACFLSIQAFAQNSVSADFDNDGTADQIKLIQSTDGFKLTCAFSSQGKKAVSTAQITTGGQENTLEARKNILILRLQYMRGTYTYKFRYDAGLRQLKLIGYENEQVGNAVHDGAGTASYNLLTGTYEAQWNYIAGKKQELVLAPKVTKKFPVKTYLLSDFGDSIIEEIGKIDYSLLPKSLK